MKKRKLAAGGYLPNYGDEQPQNPFGPSVINPTGQDMGLPSMGNPYDPYEQGYRHGGKVKMRKKMADGGMSGTTATTPFTRPARPTPPVTQSNQQTAAPQSNEPLRRANQAAYSPLFAAKRQFAPGTPEYSNYRAFLQAEQGKLKAAQPSGSDISKYTPGTYNPSTNYIPTAQQAAAALAAKKAAKEKFEAARMPATKMAKGGMASSASKRADGCAVKGKTKGRMR